LGPIEDRKNPAETRIATRGNAVAGHPADESGEVRAVDQELAHQSQDHQHAGVSVPGPSEGLLEVGHGLTASHDLQHEPAAVLDGHNGQEQDPCRASRGG
jgi:hypothetical protein